MKNKRTILIIEDEQLFADRYKKEAKKYFSHINIVSSYKEACEYLETEQADALIVDHFLPDGLGIGLLERYNIRHTDTPVVVITGKSDKQMAIDSVNLGVSYFVEKPLDSAKVSDIMEKLDALVDEKSSITKLKRKFELQEETKETLRVEYKISNREMDVINHAITKADSESIASSLDISQNTVKTHFQNIFNKLKVSSRKEIVEIVQKLNN
jgi:DNA-binding NarL/FixJ family response regulator